MITLHPQEKIELVVRKHWFAFLNVAVFFFIMALAPILLAGYFVALFGVLLALGLYCLWLVLLWIMLALEWTAYYLDVWYITNERVIDIEQKWLFHRDEAVLRLNVVQDVAVRTEGFFATLLHFGDIRVQTAGERREFFMPRAANPERVKEVIGRLHDALLERPQKVEVIG